MDTLLKVIEKCLDTNKAEDIRTLDLMGKSSLADYFVIATGISQRHLMALSDHLTEKLGELGHQILHFEGKKSASDWIILDAGDVIVHLFREETRELYNLEKMWATTEYSEAVSQ